MRPSILRVRPKILLEGFTMINETKLSAKTDELRLPRAQVYRPNKIRVQQPIRARPTRPVRPSRPTRAPARNSTGFG